MISEKTTPGKLTTRQRLLEAALTCFSRRGYHQTTTDEIVAESGLGKGTLYRHFENKQHLFVSMTRWMMEGIGEDMAMISSQPLPVIERLRAMVQVLLDDMEQLLPFFRITLDYWAHTIEDEQLREIFSTSLKEFQELLVPLFEEGIAAGELRPVNARHAALALFAQLDALTLYKALLDEIDLRGTVETALDIFLTGLKADDVSA
jgi:AcrR family transcriptional regulator